MGPFQWDYLYTFFWRDPFGFKFPEKGWKPFSSNNWNNFPWFSKKGKDFSVLYSCSFVFQLNAHSCVKSWIRHPDVCVKFAKGNERCAEDGENVESSTGIVTWESINSHQNFWLKVYFIFLKRFHNEKEMFAWTEIINSVEREARWRALVSPDFVLRRSRWGYIIWSAGTCEIYWVRSCRRLTWEAWNEAVLRQTYLSANWIDSMIPLFRDVSQPEEATACTCTCTAWSFSTSCM